MDDSEKRIGKDVEEIGRGLIKNTIPEFSWKKFSE
jgi:hypothetical protein